MPTSTIPFDIVSIIVQLAHDKYGSSTLQACAQLSRIFRIASRPSIFRKVKLATGDELIALDALLSSDPAIGAYVGSLVIQPRTAQSTSSPATWLSDIPRVLPSRLQSLQCLELTNLREMGDNCDDAFFAACAAFTSVETMVFRDSVIELHLLYAFACAFPNLAHLTVGNLRPILASIWPYPLQLVDLKLTSVTLDVGDLYRNALQSILVWLGQTATANTLRSLTVTFGPSEVPDVGLFLEKHGAVVQQLSLRIRGPPDTEQEFEGMAFRRQRSDHVHRTMQQKQGKRSIWPLVSICAV